MPHACSIQKSLGIQLTITSQHRPLPTHPSSKLLLSFFDNLDTADIAFGFHLDKSEPSHVLACKSLLSAASARFEFRKLFLPLLSNRH